MMLDTRKARRRGVGLVEVLVVVSILSLLIAVLLPAVQQVRAAAERLSCQSNLRQIGLAVQNYEAAMGRLPPAFRHRGADTPNPNLQWPLLIASYLELDPSQRMAEEDFRNSQDAIYPIPHRGLSIPLKSFSCPSDSRTSVAWEVTFGYSLARPKTTIVTRHVALNSYLGNGGELSARRDGVMVADGRLTVLSVTDGTSNTLAYGERPPPVNLNYAWGWLYVGWGVGANGYGELASIIGVKDPNPFLRYGPNPVCGPGPFPYRQPDLTAEPDCAYFQYWSLHSGGANFAFCDGSVRFLAYSADPVLAALATRAGGEVVSIPD